MEHKKTVENTVTILEILVSLCVLFGGLMLVGVMVFQMIIPTIILKIFALMNIGIGLILTYLVRYGQTTNKLVLWIAYIACALFVFGGLMLWRTSFINEDPVTSIIRVGLMVTVGCIMTIFSGFWFIKSCAKLLHK